MDESWRFPPAHGHVCPTCRVSHFPFCPPPRPFYGNGFPPDDPRRYTVEASPFRRPLPVFPPPFTEHRRISPPPPLLHHPSPMARRNVEPWNDYSLSPPEREPFRQPFHSTERLFPEDFSERDNFHKRMRVGDEVPGYPDSPQRSDRFDFFPRGISSEDERRLNLIRDHGRSQVNVPFDGEHRRNGEYFPVDRHPHLGSQSHYTWTGTDGDPHVPGLGLSVDNVPVAPNPSFLSQKNHVLRGSSFGGYQDPIGAPDFQDSDRFLHSKVKELEGRDWDVSNIVRFNPSRVEISPGPYGHSDVLSHPSRSHGYGDAVTESSKSYTLYSSDVGSKYKRCFGEDSVINSLKQIPHSPSHASQGSLEALNRRLHPQETRVSEPQYPCTNSYQASFKPNAGHYSYTDHFVHEHVGGKQETYAHGSEVPSSFECKAPLREDSFRPLDLQNVHMASQSNTQPNQRGHLAMQSSSNMITSMGRPVQAPQTSPPPPPQPRPRPPPEPSSSYFQASSLLSTGPPPVTPAPVGLSVDVSLSHTVQGLSEAPATLKTHFYDEPPENTSTGIVTERWPLMPQTIFKQHPEEAQAFSPKHVLKDKRTVVDASHIFRQPHRATRPDHIVVILRGLPGSGKSYLAKALRDLEVDSGSNAPRIHCMDDYFMTEVEKVEESDGPKSFGSVKGKKQVTKKVMEYCYEPEMEEAYRSSMLKAFKKTVEDGIFTFVIVDDRNLRVADFAQFWAIGKRSGYEVYILEATYKDPTGCAARNVHGFTLDDIDRMAQKWEEAPTFYLQLDIQSLFHGDDLNESNIQEVDMDAEDIPYDERVELEAQERKSPKIGEQTLTYNTCEVNIGEIWVTEGEDLSEARELRKSKWSEDLDEDVDEINGANQQSNALSGLIQAYGKNEKSVHWGDQVEKRGFSIGAPKKRCISSLIIGPGLGYNLKSNPLPEEESSVDGVQGNDINVLRKRSVFLEHIRAERESFRAVFDRRRQRIGGLNNVEED